MNKNERTSKSRNFLNESVRGCLAVTLSLLLIPYTQQGLFAQAPPPPPGSYAPLGAEQLNQLVAPIALYPDSLVAQILTAATYPQQVNDANNWLSQTAGMPPEQRPAAADQMPWDPSVKALTAFPSVLNNMARNYNWTGALGNAYYNQPGDIMNAVQAMRMQAQSAGTLRTGPQERVIYESGAIVIEPVNPAFVYVPYYNPWAVYGGPIVPWGGYYYIGPPRGVVLAGIGIGFGIGISLALFGHYGWGYNNWAPNWHGGVVVYNHNTYISRSTTVYNHGSFGGYNRGVYEHGGAGVPHNFHAPVTAQSAAFRGGAGSPGFRGSSYATGRSSGPAAGPGGRQFGQPSTPNRTAATPSGAGGRQFGQPNQPGRTPTAGGSAATGSRPGGNTPSYNRPGSTGNVSHTPQSTAPSHQPAASHQATPQPSHSVAATPSHQPSGGGGGQHPSSSSGGQHSSGSTTKHK